MLGMYFCLHSFTVLRPFSIACKQSFALILLLKLCKYCTILRVQVSELGKLIKKKKKPTPQDIRALLNLLFLSFSVFT